MALQATEGNKTAAARLLRTDYKTLYLKMKEYGIARGGVPAVLTVVSPAKGPVQPMNVHSTEITATTCSDDHTMASIFGKATIDGAGSHVFRIDVTDGGSGGSNDSYGILLSTGYMSGQHRLSGGNITIH